MNQFLEAALTYHQQGFHPIPCRPRAKVPMVNWKDFQVEQPTVPQIHEWWGRTPTANVALVLGRGTFAVDLDGGVAAEELLAARDIYLSYDAPRSRTGSGYHVFFKSGIPIPDRVGLLSTDGGKPQVDIRGVGIVVAPPSIHPSGATYQWEVPLTSALPVAPLGLIDLIQSATTKTDIRVDSPSAPRADSWVRDSLQGVGEGQRDHACTRLAGYFLGRGLDSDLVTTLLTESFAKNCKPVFSAVDVRKCVQSIARRERVADDGIDPITRAEHISEVIARMEAQRQAGPAPTLRTPYPVLNGMLSGGFSPGELIYVGARPGVGKTALALECARAAGKAGDATLIISREMANVSLVRRMTSQETRVASTKIKRADTLSWGELRNYESGTALLRDLPIWMTDKAVSMAAIIGTLQQLPRPIKFLVVDYLQLVRAPKGITDRRLQVEEVSKSLKTLAMELEIPVMCLSSLSRPPKTAGDPQPSLSDLRESGELEHDADVVLLLHRAFRSTDASCIVAKNREGDTGVCKLTFTPECVSFAIAAEEQEGRPSLLPRA